MSDAPEVVVANIAAHAAAGGLPSAAIDAAARQIAHQAGRWRYHIRLHKGLTQTTPGWSALGRQRAERKARRLLARRTLADRRSATTITIIGGTP